MRGKKLLCIMTALALVPVLAGCGNDSGVYVQSVKELAAMGGIAPGDRFAGMVVSENVAEIQKDGDKTIAEVLVKEGDDVKEGDPLFSYDTEELQLTLDKQRLEREQLVASIENFKSQIEQMEKDRNKVGAPAGSRPSMKTAPTTTETPCPTSPSSSPALTGSREPWASCSGAASWRAAG